MKWCSRVVTVLLGLLVAESSPASRVVCLDTDLGAADWVEKYFESADAVFLGMVTSSQSPDLGEIKFPDLPSFDSFNDYLEHIENTDNSVYSAQLTQVSQFRALEVWKGDVWPSVAIRSHVVPGSTFSPFESGETYLVFAFRQQGGSLSASTECWSSIHIDAAEQRIAELNRMSDLQSN